ncbi:thioredoxin family protein [Streptomyces sp. NPDC050504]|uniref:thioredoxin family protein n=1 Tax=Streptomyces sp. NPDC050504 TaxID=3365618 RepID=UPI00378DC60A
MIKAAGIDEVTDATFAAEVLAERDLPVLVEFTADWCPPCRQLAPVLSALAKEETGRLKVVQIDSDSNPATMVEYGVMSMPTMLVFQGGQPVLSLVGARPLRRLRQDLEGVLPA